MQKRIKIKDSNSVAFELDSTRGIVPTKVYGVIKFSPLPWGKNGDWRIFEYNLSEKEMKKRKTKIQSFKIFLKETKIKFLKFLLRRIKF